MEGKKSAGDKSAGNKTNNKKDKNANRDVINVSENNPNHDVTNSDEVKLNHDVIEDNDYDKPLSERGVYSVGTYRSVGMGADNVGGDRDAVYNNYTD